MSSHREAPGILKDPTADNTDVYAFVTPNNTVTIITNYVPVGGAGRRAELLRVRRLRHLPDQHRQQRRRSTGRDLRVPVRDHQHQPEHLPVQHRADRSARQPQLEPPPALHGHPHLRWASQDARPPRALPAVQHRAAVHAQLLGPGRCGDRRPGRGRPGVLRPAGRRASSSTSARCSTWRRCGPSSRCT